MLRLLGQISMRQLRASWGRTSLVVGGIATGVSLIVAINVINASVLANFRQTIDHIAGPAALQVTLGVGEVGFDESVVEIARADPDVVAAVPLIRGTISLADESGEPLQLFGADLTEEEELQRYRISTRHRREVQEGLLDPRSILVTAAFAGQHGIGVGDKIQLSTPQGVGEFTIRGLLDMEGLATVFGGQLAVMDLPAAQLLLQKQDRIDQVDIVVGKDADVVAVQERLERVLPQTLTVVRPEQRGQQYESILGSFQAMLTGLSLLCLVAGVYIVYNTTWTGATHRALSLAGLRVIGASMPQLFRLLMCEALALGIIGVCIGVPIGVALARLLLGMVADSMSVIFQLRFPVEAIAIEMGDRLVAAGLGVVAALFACYFAARRVTRLEPLDVMRADLRSIIANRPSFRLIACWRLRRACGRRHHDGDPPQVRRMGQLRFDAVVRVFDLRCDPPREWLGCNPVPRAAPVLRCGRTRGRREPSSVSNAYRHNGGGHRAAHDGRPHCRFPCNEPQPLDRCVLRRRLSSLRSRRQRGGNGGGLARDSAAREPRRGAPRDPRREGSRPDPDTSRAHLPRAASRHWRRQRSRFRSRTLPVGLVQGG
jgi:ABC-type lipoprotein release transport system permease subunit